ncbi:hypothetical protein K470DRAFT_248784 [Piedraia hortae CBS 480.64]|uniref:Nucleosome assembly protein n=1 Tax=Piedraia hortae CBS 480.64 TaxID=1314780 RepID=A0A6A7BX27_9PEZI|nr:hypothetical protein K470DRAFT_248784 [Piedraia hortae CBS 480.64]
MTTVTYEDLAALEEEFTNHDTATLKYHHNLTLETYARRTALLSRIPHFWALVFEQAPPEIDTYIQPQDSFLFAEHLTSLTLTRENVEREPRDFALEFHFSKNPFFEDGVLVKRFWYRKARDGWAGVVSQPVRIRWKEGRDLTRGLTEGVWMLWERRGRDGWRVCREYEELKKKVVHWNGGNTSFFTWFGWVSGRRYVTAEEDEEVRKGGKVDEELEEGDEQEVEVHPAGEEIAMSIAEDVWPHAIKLFTQAQEGSEEENGGDDDDSGEDVE